MYNNCLKTAFTRKTPLLFPILNDKKEANKKGSI